MAKRARSGSPLRARAALRVETVRTAFDSDAALAETLGVDRSRVSRWLGGEIPDPENEEQLIGLDTVISLLHGFLEDASIPKWLRGVNAHLGERRPLDVVRAGRLSEVIAAIEAEKSGAFA
ncbi:MAG: hypothetical protein M3373_01755 [Gemmatimonadota bacterium]|nr:hypothetical protein [Gemmatimonadota bacterium]